MDTSSLAKFIKYNGRTYRLQTSGRYYQDQNHHSTKERLLHRKIWFDEHGSIPDGYEVHHKDGDWTNNKIENLECISGQEHASLHLKKRWQDPSQREQFLLHSALNRELTKAWHASPEGLAWHSENGKKSWLNRPLVNLVCVGCGGAFHSRVSTRKWCNSACYQRGNKHKLKQEKETRICVMCGNGFECKKHTKTCTCGTTCRANLIAYNRKDRKTPILKTPLIVQ